MADITVRKVDFDFPEDTPLYALPGMPRVSDQLKTRLDQFAELAGG